MTNTESRQFIKDIKQTFYKKINYSTFNPDDEYILVIVKMVENIEKLEWQVKRGGDKIETR